MTTLKRILAATDFSAPARHAAERAALLSRATGASLDLLHVANLAPLERLRQLLTPTSGDLPERMLEVSRQRLRGLAALLAERYRVEAGVQVFTGSVVAAIGREADAGAPSLVVCGATGESVIRHLLLGSTAERLLSRAICPVLVAKQVPRSEYRRLLVAVDLSPSSVRAIRHAQAIAPQADLVILHVFEVPFEGHMRYAGVKDETIDHYRDIARREAMEKLRALSEETGLAARAVPLILLHGNPVLRILEQEQEQDCDLIVMGKDGQGGLEELLLGSVTKRVLAESQSDVLVST
jgi:nucleotide-binding universal stress UspA family protein